MNLCSRPGGCCPKLITINNKKLKFKVTDDYGGVVKLTVDEARNLALAIFKEIGK